jgi:hypothetical protein
MSLAGGLLLIEGSAVLIIANGLRLLRPLTSRPRGPGVAAWADVHAERADRGLAAVPPGPRGRPTLLKLSLAS